MNNNKQKTENINMAQQKYAQGAIQIDQEKLQNYINNSVLEVDVNDKMLWQ